MESCHRAVKGVMALLLFCSATSTPAAEEKVEEKVVVDSKADAGQEAVFDMKEVSLFDQKERAAISEFPIFDMRIASLRTEPAKEVKTYPKLNSKQPLYGSMIFDRDSEKPSSATKFYFALDESGTAENADEKATKSEADKSATNNPRTNRYERLYFDLDGDLDLTNAAVISPMKDPPNSLVRLLDGPQTTAIFNTVSIPLGEVPKAKGQAVSVLPVIVLYGNTYEGNAGRMVFMAAMSRKGEIRLGKRAYHALLVPRSGMTGRMSHPSTPLILTPVDRPKPVPSNPSMDILGAIREADGEFYRISATPSGDQLTVRAFGGERGVFELSVGNKDIKPLGMAGSLALQESKLQESMLLLGEMGDPVQDERAMTAKYRPPVGDYRPLSLRVDCGDLRVSLRAGYTLNLGAASQRAGSIEIRKDKPYVLDFATKPEVHFLAPAEGEAFKPGDEIRLAAMLRIPHKGLLIDGLEDMSKKVGEMEDGKQMSSPRYASLEPMVVITDSSGKKLAEGTMPFG